MAGIAGTAIFGSSERRHDSQKGIFPEKTTKRTVSGVFVLGCPSWCPRKTFPGHRQPHSRENRPRATATRRVGRVQTEIGRYLEYDCSDRPVIFQKCVSALALCDAQLTFWYFPRFSAFFRTECGAIRPLLHLKSEWRAAAVRRYETWRLRQNGARS